MAQESSGVGGRLRLPGQRRDVDAQGPKGIGLVRSLPGHLQKNRGLFANTEFWKMTPRIAAGAVRPRRNAEADQGLTRFVATHHKVMTTYFSAVLRLFATATSTPFAKQGFRGDDPEGGLVLSMHGTIDLDALDRYRGVHLMRDPRDVVISSYHYHKWTQEPWAHLPDETGQSYQQRLNSMTMEEGIHMEIDHFTSSYGELLRNWDVDDPDILEIKFADLMGSERNELYEQIFTHLGYTGREHRLGCDLMRAFEASARTGGSLGKPRERNHVRSAGTGQWADVLSPSHIDHMEDQLGVVLDKFGFRDQA